MGSAVSSKNIKLSYQAGQESSNGRFTKPAITLATIESAEAQTGWVPAAFTRYGRG
jgi:hypothetical protein